MSSDGQAHWKKLIIDANALVWLDNKENWQQWEDERGWWRKFRAFLARHFTDDRYNPNRKSSGPIMGPRKF
jgi:hypothetical protein